MYEQVEKPKKNKSDSVANSVTQKKSDGRQGFVDNRPKAVAQRKLQEMENNDFQPIQRVIKLRNGATFNKGGKKDRANIKKMKNLRGIFLFENSTSLNKANKGNNKGVKILTPNKHIIGEHHQNSRFQQAVNDWGWGAQQMRESLSENNLMPHIAGAEARLDVNRNEYQALPQEDTMVKNLALLLAARGPIHALTAVAGIGAIAYNVQARTLLQAAAGDFNCVLHCTNDLQGYYDASPSFLSRIWNWTNPRPLVNRIGRAIAGGVALANMYQMLGQQQQNNPNYIMTQPPLTLGLARIDELIAIYKELINQTQNDLYTRHNLGVAANIDHVSGAREEHMSEKIEQNLGAPGLVKVGRNHLPGLRGVSNGLLFNDYDDFKYATSAVEVFKRLNS